MVVYFHLSSFSNFNSSFVSIQSVCVRTTTYRNQRVISFKSDDFAFSVLSFHNNSISVSFNRLYFVRSIELHSLFFQHFSQFFRQSTIHTRDDSVHEFNNRNLSTKTQVNLPKLDSDNSTTDDYQVFWHFFKFQSFCRSDDSFFVNFDERQRRWLRTCSDDSVFSFDSLRRSVSFSNCDVSSIYE